MDESKTVNDVVVYPKIPLTPQVTATIIQGGIAVYATSVVAADDALTSLLFRRIDTDYINGSVLLSVTFLPAPERLATLAATPDSFFVKSSNETGIAGTWVTLASARALVKRFPVLSHLTTFLEDELGERFPEPIPSMRAGLRAALATSSSSVLGYPPLADAHVVLNSAKLLPSPPLTNAQTGRKRKTSNAVASEQPPVVSLRKTRRSVAAK